MNQKAHSHNRESSTMSRLNPLSHLRHILLRGGRLRKTARGLVTFAPALGALATAAAVAPLALAATMIFLSGDSVAGQCTGTNSGDGSRITFHCTYAPAPNADSTIQLLTHGGGRRIFVTDSDNFGVDVNNGHGMRFYSFSGHNGISATGLETADISARGRFPDNVPADAIWARDNSPGTVSFVIGRDSRRPAEITSQYGRGIYLGVTGSGDNSITLNAGGVITAGGDGIFVNHRDNGGLNITLNPSSKINNTSNAGAGIHVDSTSSRDIRIVNNGGIGLNTNVFNLNNAVGGDGIRVINNGRGAVHISGNRPIVTRGDAIHIEGGTNAGDITIDTINAITTGSFTLNNSSFIRTRANDGVQVVQRGPGNININIRGVVTAGDPPTNDAGPAGIVGTSDARHGMHISNWGGGTTTVAVGRSEVFNESAFDSRAMFIESGANTGTMRISTGFARGVGEAIRAEHRGSGNLEITAGGAHSDRRVAIAAYTRNNDSTGLTIRTNGTVRAEGGTFADGINADHDGGGEINIHTRGAIIAGSDGIITGNDPDGTNINITTNGAITAGDHGIRVFQNGRAQVSGGSGATNITVSGGAISSAGTDGILVTDDDRNGNITVTLRAQVGGSGDAIDLRGGGSHTVVFESGGSINANDHVRSDRTDATLELGDDRCTGCTFNLANMANFTGFTFFDKADSGTWVLTGEMPTNKVFTSDTTWEDGNLRFEGNSRLRTGAGVDLTIPDGSTLQVSGRAIIHADLEADAGTSITLADTDTNDELAVANFTSGGTLTLNIDITNADNTADQFNLFGSGRITAGTGGATTVNLRAIGTTMGNFETGSGAPVLIRDGATGDNMHIDGGVVRIGREEFAITLARTESQGRGEWRAATIAGTGTQLMKCTEDDNTGGTFICAFAAAADDMTQALAAAASETLIIQNDPIDPTFGIDVDSGNAFTLTTDTASTGITFNLNGAITSQTGDGINAHNSGTGATSITAGGAIMAQTEGIEVNHDGDAALTITAAAITSTAEDGIIASTAAASTDLTITANGAISASTAAKDGINADHDGSGALAITTAGAITAGNRGIQVDTAGTSTTATITANADITATTAAGISATHLGSGAMSVTLGADATISAVGTTSGHGINVQSSNADAMVTTGGMTIDAQGDIGTSAAPVGKSGILANHQSPGELSITAGVIHATEHGITATNMNGRSSGAMSITANGAISAAMTAIDADHAGSGNLTITTTADITGMMGIAAEITDDTSTDDIFITIGGAIDADDGDDDASTASTAISMTGGGDHILTLAPGASIASGDAVTSDITSADTGRTATLVFTSAEDTTAAEDSFNLADFANFSGFTDLRVDGAGTWTFTGDQPAANAFNNVNVEQGTLRLQDATFRPGDSTLTITANTALEITGTTTIHGAINNQGLVRLNNAAFTITPASGAGVLTLADALEVTGANTITGGLDNSSGGAISLALDEDANTDDGLTITGAFTPGSTGSVTFAIDLSETAADAPVLNLMGTSAAGTLTLNLAITGDLANLPDPEGADAVTLITGTDAANVALAEEAGDCTINGDACTYVVDTTEGDWVLQAVQRAGAVAGDAQSATLENYAAALVEFSRLSSLQERLSARHYYTAEPHGFWGQITTAQNETTPSAAATNSSREVQHTSARFGMEVPLTLTDLPLDNISLGANFWLGKADTQTASAAGAGEITTDGHGIGITATLAHPVENGGGFGKLLHAPWKLISALLPRDPDHHGDNHDRDYHRSAGDGTFYADAQFQYAAFASDITAASTALTSNHDATAFNTSLELGYHLPPTRHGTTFTPHLQFTWNSIDFDPFTPAASADAAQISMQDGDTRSLRLGLAATRDLDLDIANSSSTLPTTLHATASIHLPLDGETAAKIADTQITSETKDPAFSLSAAFLHALTPAATASAELSTTHSDETEEYRATLGARFAF